MAWRRLHPEKTLNVIFDCPEERVLDFFVADSAVLW